MDLFEPWIESCGGRKVEFLNPKPDQIEISEIAWALANQCRFNGHCKRFYSVAEHSVLVSALVSDSMKLQALLHDAAEAYLCDIPSPLKPYLDGYRKIEKHFEKVIFSKYNCPTNPPKAIKDADREMLSIEAFFLLPSKGNAWTLWDEYPRPKIKEEYQPIGLKPAKAFDLFMSCFHRYSGTKAEAENQIVLPETVNENISRIAG